MAPISRGSRVWLAHLAVDARWHHAHPSTTFIIYRCDRIGMEEVNYQPTLTRDGTTFKDCVFQ